ncbi:MAG: hypothetical protein M3O50_03125 [Myxococcota bacterium]|nr:hypothetical protein [Myxococcota bacterium]
MFTASENLFQKLAPDAARTGGEHKTAATERERAADCKASADRDSEERQRPAADALGHTGAELYQTRERAFDRVVSAASE